MLEHDLVRILVKKIIPIICPFEVEKLSELSVHLFVYGKASIELFEHFKKSLKFFFF